MVLAKGERAEERLSWEELEVVEIILRTALW
jgi:hypothetical protein